MHSYNYSLELGDRQNVPTIICTSRIERTTGENVGEGGVFSTPVGSS